MEYPRCLIVFDGRHWHVRRVAVIEEDLTRGHMVYRCDEPLKNDLVNGTDAMEWAITWQLEHTDASNYP